MRTAATMLLGSLAVYACGVAVLAPVADLSLRAALSAGVVPFLLGDLIKITMASALLPSAWRLLGRG